MCGRSAISERARIEAKFAINRVGQYDVIKRDVVPRDTIPIVVQSEGQRILSSARWGLSINGKVVYNCRSEGLDYQWLGLSKQRCIIPMDQFVEHGLPGGVTFEARNGDILSVAGLFEIGLTGDGVYHRRAGVLTCFATEPVVKYHHRMPVVIDDAHLNDWLDPSNHASSIVKQLPTPELITVPQRSLV